MGLSPLRLAAALVFGGMVTGALYLSQQAIGRPLPAASAAASPQRAHSAAASKTALPLATPPKRIVFRQTAPGDVVLTVRDEELQVEFVPAKAPNSVSKPPVKLATKLTTKPPLKTTPVATP